MYFNKYINSYRLVYDYFASIFLKNIAIYYLAFKLNSHLSTFQTISFVSCLNNFLVENKINESNTFNIIGSLKGLPIFKGFDLIN